jgi:ATP phosphoribosyltransferase
MRVALPNKGRLADDARELFTDAGLPLRIRGDRALTASLGDCFEAIFVRSEDIPEFVCDGAADFGVTGRDLVDESGRDVREILDLEFGRCRLAVAARDDSGITTVADVQSHARVATAFPRTTRRYFDAAGIPVSIVPVSGAAEIAPHLGIADVIVDLVSTGSTLRVNGLRELATISHSSARLITARDRTLDAPTQTAVDDLVGAVASVIRARSQRYVMANVPRRCLTDAKRVLPGMNGPTVVDILNGGELVAMHAVVPADTVQRTIADLRAIGASGILVTRIERLVP